MQICLHEMNSWNKDLVYVANNRTLPWATSQLADREVSP